MADQGISHQRLLHFEDCASAIDQLFKSALENEGPSAFFDYLNFIRRLRNLSVFNAMLVKIQRPGAMAVGSRSDWKRINRYVLPDAIPIIVLQPFGPVRFLFDYIDTQSYQPSLLKDDGLFFNPTGSISGLAYDEMVHTASKCGILIEDTLHYGGLRAGTAALVDKLRKKDIDGKESTYWRIRINGRLDIIGKHCTLSHELGHIYCGHLGGDPRQNRWPARTRLSKGARELEAEAVSWLVSTRIGIKTISVEYLSGYITEENVHEISPYCIFSAANRIESRTGAAKK